ncbi:hypothetical protein GHT06_020333 [Daphnia sinensis]|uniref:Helitron helicase-like domain-containing protein n=1 Tax=Daphnia sinensis TaxID=1820382 RepID=A0AAD5KL95_9CRUS|nr:hypothetical protein GHT06_020333 [Daphnia sinensis]
MSIRDYFNNVLAGGSLTQQWTVDSYVKIEANRVKYIREHQAELHVAQYDGLLDYLHNRAERENLTVGSYHVLPSSFIGSPRAMKQAYQDAMAICGKFGKQGNHGQYSQPSFGTRSAWCSRKSFPPKED